VLSRRGASEAGRLRLRLELQKAIATPDEAGGATLAWNSVATIAAEVIPLKAEERSVGEGLAVITRVKVVIRSRGDVAAGDRFRLGERVLSIRGVFDPDEDGRFLVCLCDEEKEG
jgi:SPP1 family predicted phage head-tail adaptor